MAKDFKARGISWLGSITIYAFLQQCGLQNDHCATCFRNPLSDCHEPPPATSTFGAASPVKHAARTPAKRAAPSAAGPGKTRQTAKAGKADKAGKGGTQKAPVAAASKKRHAGTSRTAKTAPGSAGKTPESIPSQSVRSHQTNAINENKTGQKGPAMMPPYGARARRVLDARHLARAVTEIGASCFK